jgi:carbonic anhydrase
MIVYTQGPPDITTTHPKPLQRQIRATGGLVCLLVALGTGLASTAFAKDPVADSHAGVAKKPEPSASAAKPIGDQVREALDSGTNVKKRVTLVINGKEKKYITIPLAKREAPPEPPEKEPEVDTSKVADPAAIVNSQASRQYIRARAVALTGRPSPPLMPKVDPMRHAGPLNWAYEGAGGPQAWGKLQPEFSLCASGKRQSPINIEESQTLRGPAEPLQFSYQPSNATVRHDGHTIEVNVVGDNALTVRGSTYKLVQLHFHHPAEERVNNQGFAMVVHLLHKNEQGQLAMLAVLLEPGEANALINKVWTYMPLDKGDQVPMPAGMLDLNELLPKDQRYYQFFGSLTTPPCTEDVLWLILKQTATASKEQIKLFSQLFPNNARPTQATNGRPVRDAQ